jgi:phosphoglycerate kinase
VDKKTLRDIEVEGKRVLVRVDFNVPLDRETGAITDDIRIRAALPTIDYLIGQGAKVILCSHLGRPGGKAVDRLRLVPIGQRLSELLSRPVSVAQDCVGREVRAAVAGLKPGEVLLLENLRFHIEEERNNPAFAQALSRLAEIYVNDAFGTMHRAHASTEGIARYLPAVAGFLVEKELDVMDRSLNSPVRPFAAIIGGAKMSDKIAVLENILERVDLLLIGGGMASTFLKAQDLCVGRSAIEEDKLGIVVELIERARGKDIRLLLPIDVVVASSLDTNAVARTVPVGKVPAHQLIADIGPRTIELFGRELRSCGTVIWNGPMGVFEIAQFAQGTRGLVRLVADLEATTVIGGGSTAEAVEEMGLGGKMSHVSTGGGATLEFLGGRTLPGVAVLLDKND